MNSPLPDLVKRIEQLEQQVALLNASHTSLPHYSVAQFAERVQRASYTVREWARLGRIQATRRAGRGPYQEYVISHLELMRYREQGLRSLHHTDDTRGE